MQKIKHTLDHWRELQVTAVPLERIETDEVLQPRTRDAVAVKHRHRLDEASDLHIARMREDLATFVDKETEPLLVAETDGRLLLVDGHHRLSAYRLAGRQTAPARVLSVSRSEAVMVSKLVNCDGVKLPLHPDQAREAAWQYLAHVTTRGRMPLPSGASLRTVAAIFKAGKSTVGRMLAKLPAVDLNDYSEEAKDPGTGWPRWRHVRDSAWHTAAASVPLENRRQAQAERLAEKVAALMDKAGPEVARIAAAILLTQRQDEATDLLSDWRDAEDGIETDY